MYYTREPYSNVDAVHVTRFLGLAPVGNKDKQASYLSTISNYIHVNIFVLLLIWSWDELIRMLFSCVSDNILQLLVITSSFYALKYSFDNPLHLSLLLRNLFTQFLLLQHLQCLVLRLVQSHQPLPYLHTHMGRKQIMQQKLERDLAIAFLIHSTGDMMSTKKGRNMELEMVIGCVLSLYPLALVLEGKIATFSMM